MSDGFDGCDFCRRQALKVEELNERIRQLEAQLYGKQWDPPLELGLTACEASILQTLFVRDRIVTRDFLLDATRASGRSTRQDPGDKLIDTMVCKLRQKLRKHSLHITTVVGRGFCLPEDTRQQLLNWPTRTEHQRGPSDRAA